MSENSFEPTSSKKSEKEMNHLRKVRRSTDLFADGNGRRPRILIVEMIQGDQDTINKILAAGYADLGFDVDIGPVLQNSFEVAKQAIENDVHVLQISSLTEDFKIFVSQVLKKLKDFGREDILVVVNGLVSVQDSEFLFKNGMEAVFAPSDKIIDSAIQVMKLLNKEQ